MGSEGAAKQPYAFLDAWKTTVVRNNRFHYGKPSAFGIDLDDGSSNYEIYNNLLLNTSVKLREGFGRKVYNNIMINRGADLHVWYDECADQLHNNIIASSSAYNLAYLTVDNMAAKKAVINSNVFYNAGNSVSIGFSGWTGMGFDVNSVTANPLFTNPNTLNYSVATNSPAIALGFVNFPMDQFGKPGSPTPAAIDFVTEADASADPEPLMGAKACSIYNTSIQSALGAPDLKGVYFQTVPVDSYAANQGFLAGDVIRSINGTSITSKQSFWLIYHTIKPGTSVTITRLRNQVEGEASFTKTTASEMLNNTAGVVYTGTWSNQVNTSSFNSDIRYNRTTGDYFELTFYGTGVSFTSQKNTDMGKLDVYIDGVLNQTISCYNASRIHQQTVFSVSGLSDGVHTLKAVNAETKYQILDAITVSYNPDSSMGNKVVFKKLPTNVLIYPTPVSDLLSIELTGSDVAMVEFINTAGITLFSKNINSGKNSIDVGGLSPGIYIVKITDTYKLITRKIIKQ
jgi:hypothetical protein